MASLAKLAKSGDYEAVKSAIDPCDLEQLKSVFSVAATDFRTVKRRDSHQQILKHCIDLGLSPDLPLGWMEVPAVCWAAMYGNAEIVEYFDVGDIKSPFIAASLGEIDLLYEFADDLSVVVYPNGFNLLHFVALSALGKNNDGLLAHQIEISQLLIKHGVDSRTSVFNTIDLFPAFLCSWFGGNRGVMEVLIDNGGLPADRFPSTLEFALEPHQRSGAMHDQIASLLIDRGYDINMPRPEQGGRTVLHGCANRGSLQPVEWLIHHGASVDAVDQEMRTPLHAACERNTSTGVVQLLVNSGADLLARNIQGENPLDTAIRKDRKKVVEFLSTVVSAQQSGAPNA